MKRKLAVLLALLCLSTVLLPGCKRGEKQRGQASKDTQASADRLEEITGLPAVSVLIDLPSDAEYAPGSIQKTLQRMPGYNKDFVLQLTLIPSRVGTERDIDLTRIRTEIMAGKGPDLFLCSQGMVSLSATLDDKALFNFPVQAMSNHIFLPLDDYIDKAEYIEWDKLQPVVMDAGKNEEGQQIMPLSYVFTVTLFDHDLYTPKEELPMTWEEMTESSDPAIRVSSNGFLPDIIGELADYSKDVPAFSEDELRIWAARTFDTWQTIPEDMRNSTTVSLDQETLTRCDIHLDGEQEYTMVPVYNLSGGVTANITTFAAINRNARHPDEAFRIIDYLLSPKVQQSSPLFQKHMEGLPVYTGTGDDMPQDSYWKMNEVNYHAVNTAQEQINIAKFPGPLDTCIWEVEMYNDEVLEKSAHEQYVLMEMLLAES